MSSQILIEQYPTWYIGLCLLFGAVGALLLYFRDRSFADATNTQRRWLPPALGFLRFAALSGIALLLLSPIIKKRFIDEIKPYILLLQDNSESIKSGFKNANDSAQFANAFRQLADTLANDFQVQTYRFGDQLKKDMPFSYDQKTTNLSQALDELYNVYGGQNVGAIVIATDGIYNQGSNPLYTSESAGIPLYSVALGDTTPKRDIVLDRVLYNRIAYLGDKFTIRAEMSARNAKGENTALSVFKDKVGSSKLFGKPVSIATSNFLHAEEVVLNADVPGLHHYIVQALPVTGELTEQNNQQNIYVEVIDNRQKILMLAASPHPDLSAIKQTLETSRNTQITSSIVGTFTGQVRDYDVVILHGLPSATNTAVTESIIDQIKKTNTPVLFILSGQTQAEAFNKAQDLIQINGASPGNTSDAKGELSTNFNLFTLEGNINRALLDFPPLLAPFGKYQTSPTAQVLVKQKIGTVTTDYPLIALSAPAASKKAVICGEGLWRWKISDFRTDQSYEIFNELIGKTIQYLAIKNDKRKFKVNTPKALFNENEQITFDAELYNDSYELINTPEVNINIYNDASKSFPFSFNRSGKAYKLNAGFLPAGTYTYQAKTIFNGQEFTASGKFTIAAIQLETMQTTANHALLHAMSQKTGGEVVSPDSISSIFDKIKNKDTIKPIQYSTYKTEPFINLKWLFAIIIALLTVEWFVRKFMGGY